MARRTGTRVVLMVARKGDAESVRQAKAVLSELAHEKSIAGGAHREIFMEFSSAADLRQRVAAEKAAFVYLSQGLDGAMSEIAKALSGETVLTVGAERGYAEKGCVLGLEMASGQVKLVVNLAQSKKQHVAFQAAFLGLARVIR